MAVGAETAQKGTPEGEEGRASDTGQGAEAGEEDAARGPPFDLAELKAKDAVVKAYAASDFGGRRRTPWRMPSGESGGAGRGRLQIVILTA